MLRPAHSRALQQFNGRSHQRAVRYGWSGPDRIAESGAAFSGSCVDGGRVERAESLMWFWLLGAYEVVRTMHQAKACFSERLVRELSGLRKMLAAVRMPAAKRIAGN